ncbi:NADPH-dependent F420 reductase [Sodalis ligni]|uniref:NADPH-dependent F420 reductase n=1 Tax=Sodalis ligni TaxID=2697027 RepID=UPI002097BB7B|nr:NAD(P)-binding domain-containing protein [Sodalis ligni]
MSTISIIGSGGMAAAIGGLAAKAGHAVEVMSRDAAKARALAEQAGARATTGTFGAVPAGDIVILAVPYSAVLNVVKQYGDKLAGKLLVDITNPVAADLTSFVTPGDSSGAQEIARAAPADAVIVKAFNTLFSHVLAAGSFQGRSLDVFIAGDDARAKGMSRYSLRASDCARWISDCCPWRGRWNTSACCRWACSHTPSSTPTFQSGSAFPAELTRSTIFSSHLQGTAACAF